MQDFHNLRIWHKSHAIVISIYEFSKHFPKEELYGLTSQIRRCAVSIPSNIAEGCGRNSKKEFHYFLNLSMGSAAELEYQLLLSKDLKYISENEYNNNNQHIIEFRKMLNVFMQSIRSKA